MQVFRSAAVAALVLGTAFAAPLHAQAGKECSVDEGSPTEVARAYLAISQVAGDQSITPDQEKGKLSEAIGMLTRMSPSAPNPVGRHYELGKLLVLWTTVPNVSMTMQRGTLGYATNPTGMISLPAAIDSAFDVVEAAQPGCADETFKWRSQKGFITVVNQSIQELNAGGLDSAAVHAQEALLFNDRSPYGYMVLAQVEARRQQTDSAITLYQQGIKAAGNDTVYAQVRQQLQLNLGTTAASAAGAATDPAKKAEYYKAAQSSLQALSSDSTAQESVRESASSALVNVNLALGDSASAKSAYMAQLTNPSQFSFREVLQAGVAASKVGDDSSALKLFHDAYDMNPYHRDAITNLTIYELRAQHFDTAKTLLSRLQDIDPDGNNTRLTVLTYAGLAQYYQELNKDLVSRYAKAKTAKLKQTLTDSAALTADSNRVYTDLAVQTNVRADSAPVVVSFTQFSNVHDTVTLAGNIANQTTSQHTYALKVDFLDKTGAVVASQSATVGPVESKQAGQFSVTVSAPGITAFKYAPLDH